jgi:hypothetical protein
VLVAVSVHAQGGHDRVLGGLDAVNEQGQQIEPAEIRSHQLPQLLGGAGHEAARDRGARGRLRLHPYRLQPSTVAAGGQPVQHPVQGGLGEQVPAGEVAEAPQFHFLASLGPSPRLLDTDPPATQGQLPVLTAVAIAGPLGIVLAARAHQQGDLLLEDLVHHGQADADAEGQQTLAGALAQLGEGDGDSLRKREGRLLAGDADQARTRYGCHERFLLWLGRPLPYHRHGGVEDRSSISTN